LKRPLNDPPHDLAPTGAERARLRLIRETSNKPFGRDSLEEPSRQFKRAYARKMTKLDKATAKRETLKRRH
jgi:hypothetical protein